MDIEASNEGDAARAIQLVSDDNTEKQQSCCDFLFRFVTGSNLWMPCRCSSDGTARHRTAPHSSAWHGGALCVARSQQDLLPQTAHPSAFRFADRQHQTFVARHSQRDL